MLNRTTICSVAMLVLEEEGFFVAVVENIVDVVDPKTYLVAIVTSDTPSPRGQSVQRGFQ